MPDRKPGKDADILSSTGTDAAHERRKAAPDAADMTDPKEVWKEGETTPSRDEVGVASGGRGRVADGGDLDKGQPSPYSAESQADAVAKQTGRKAAPGNVEKPKQ